MELAITWVYSKRIHTIFHVFMEAGLRQIQYDTKRRIVIVHRISQIQHF